MHLVSGSKIYICCFLNSINLLRTVFKAYQLISFHLNPIQAVLSTTPYERIEREISRRKSSIIS